MTPQFICYCLCIPQPVKQPPSKSPPPNEEAVISGDQTPSEIVQKTEVNSPSKNYSKTPQQHEMQQHELLTTAHLHFTDDELSSMQTPEEANYKNT